MQGVEFEKIVEKYNQFNQSKAQKDKEFQETFSKIDENLQIGLKNANQGEIGYPNAVSKIEKIKVQLSDISKQLVDEVQESLKMD